MGKYEQYNTRPKTPPRKREVHAIWRGIGFVLIVMIPFMSYIGALISVGRKCQERMVWNPGGFDITLC